MQVRVLHIGPLPPPAGGMATVVSQLSQTLQDQCDVAILDNAKTTPAHRTLLQGIKAQLRLLARLNRILWQWRPDIVHIHTCSDFTFWRNGLDVMMGKLFHRKVILHIHGGRFHEFLDGLGPGKAWLARLILGWADRVIVLGRTWEERLGRWCPPGRIEMVPNGVSIPADEPSIGGAKASGIVCVAHYGRLKGLEDLIRAVAGVQVSQPVRVTLVGHDAEQGYRQVLERLAVEVGIRDRVCLTGPVRSGDVSQYLRAAEVFCLPSYNEGLPMALLEAMAQGLPVVATRVGSIPEAVNHGIEGFLYEAGDVPTLTVCLEKLLSDRELARRMGDDARRRVVQDFGVDTMVMRVLELYCRLLRERTGPTRRGHATRQQ